MKTEDFFDTNILIYTHTSDDRRAKRSLTLLGAGGVVSVQVLNEYVHTLRWKFSVSWAQATLASERIRELCVVVSLTEETHVRGLALATRHSLSVYDGMIIAAAQLAGCRVLYSEDMHDGLVINGLAIRNPFAGS